MADFIVHIEQHGKLGCYGVQANTPEEARAKVAKILSHYGPFIVNKIKVDKANRVAKV